MSRRALITGVTGQDGSYLADRLLADGWEVHGIVRPGDDTTRSAEITTHEIDLTDTDAMTSVVRDLTPAHLYNLAAISSVAQSWDDPVEVARVNGLGALALMEAAWQAQEEGGEPIAFVQASSAEIFGEPSSAPQDEQTPLRPLNPYGAAKSLAHLGAEVYRQRGLAVSSLILYNHESPRRPERFVTRKITMAAAAIARGDQDELRLGNLDARRDWGWAPDYVDAMVRAADHPEAADYVIATGESRSVRDFVEAAFTAAGIDAWEPHVTIDPAFYRPADATELVGRATRAREVLGWEPSVSFQEMVKEMVRHDLES